jgi:hypothetical protein
MSEDAIKIRVGADGATQAAEQIAKLTAQL